MKENKNRVKPEQFLLQPHTLQENCRQKHPPLSSRLCCQDWVTGCHDSHSTTAASSRARNLPLETRSGPNLANVACSSVHHWRYPPVLGGFKKHPSPAPLTLPPCNPAHGPVTLEHHRQEEMWICPLVTSCKAQATAAAETRDPPTAATPASPGRGTNCRQQAAGLCHRDGCDRKDKINQNSG